jgi:hypothetical protein
MAGRWSYALIAACVVCGGLVGQVLAVPDIWDPRLDQICDLFLEDVAASVSPGQGYWRLVEATFEDETESGFNHHIYYRCLDVNGNPIENQKVWASWSYTSETDFSSQLTKGAVDGYWGNFAMYAECPPGACGWPYNAYVDSTAGGSPLGYAGPSDKLWGMGMHNPNGTPCGAHVNFRLTWRWTIKQGGPELSRSPATLSPSAQEGTNASSDSFEVWNSGGAGTVTYTITDNAAWLSVSPPSGDSTGEHDTIAVNYSTSGLSAGSYSATITITDPNAANSPQTIAVNLSITGSGSGTISGFVKDTSNNPLSGAVVQTTPGGHSAISAGDGSYSIAAVPVGTYTVTASKAGYSTGQQTGVGVTDGGTATVNFNLAPSAPFAGLRNGDFEGGGYDDPDGEHRVANNWNKFVDSGSPQPKHSVVWYGSNAHSPDWVQAFWESSYTAGLYQQVSGATTGGDYTASVWVYGEQIRFRVGIDPTGGTDWASGNIVWSGQTIGTASWQQISAQATASASTVTVFLKCTNPDGFSRESRFDDAVLSEDSVPQDPTIFRSPSSLSPTINQGETAPSASFDVANVGAGTLNYSITDDAAWLDVDPASGASTGEVDTITVNYTTASLAPGTYNATITITDAAATNSPQTIPVTLTVSSGSVDPTISVSPASLSPAVQEGFDAGDAQIQVSNVGGGTLNYTVSDDAAWLSVNPSADSSTGEIDTLTVSYTTASLTAGTYNATITVSDAAATNDPQTIPVTLTVSAGASGSSHYALAWWREKGTWENGGGLVIDVWVFDENGDPMPNVNLRTSWGVLLATTNAQGRASIALWNYYNFLDLKCQDGAGSTSDVAYPMTTRRWPNWGHYSYEVGFLFKENINDPGTFDADTNCTVNLEDSTETDAPYTQSLAYNAINCPNNNSDDASLGNWQNPPSYFGQTFVASANRVVAARAHGAIGGTDLLKMKFQICEWPSLTPVGPVKETPADYPFGYVVTWAKNDVAVTPGETYMLKVWRDPGGMNAFSTNANVYGSGQYYEGTNANGGRDLIGFVCCMDYSGAPPVIIGSGPTATNVQPNSAVITWTTNVASTSTVEYGETSAYGQDLFDPTLVTNHSVTLTSLSPGQTYHFRVKSSASGYATATSPDDTFFTPTGAVGAIGGTTKDTAEENIREVVVTATPGGHQTIGGYGTYALESLPVGTYDVNAWKAGYCEENATGVAVTTGNTTELDFVFTDGGNAVANHSFDTDLSGWTKWGSSLSRYGTTEWAIYSYTGAGYAGWVVNFGGAGGNGGIYQTVSGLEIGRDYNFSTYFYTDSWDGPERLHEFPTNVSSRFGVDLTGGTDPDAPTVAWTSWQSSHDHWTPLKLTAPATGTTATVFLEFQCADDHEWNKAAFDDVYVTPVACDSGPTVAADFDDDGDVDLTDYGVFLGCYNGPGNPPAQAGCDAADFDDDGDVDLTDYGVFLGCYNGPGNPPACS